MKTIAKNQHLLFFGIFIFFLIFLNFKTVNAVDEENDELIESAMNYLKMDQSDKAIQILEKVLEKDPNNVNILKNLAVAYTKSQMCDKSIKLYDNILDQKPNSAEILYGKAICFNDLGQPENALSTLEKIDKKYSNDNSILIAKAHSNVLLRNFENSKQLYQKVLDKDPDHKLASINMIKLSVHLKDHILAEKYLVNLIGDEPKRTSICGGTGCMGNIQFLFPVKDSETYQITAQIQVRNESNALIGIIESETINYTPHPIMNRILSAYDVVNTIQNEYGTFEQKRIIQKTEPLINSYFMDRVELVHNDYSVLFAYNLAIPLESGDYIVTEWIINKKLS